MGVQAKQQRMFPRGRATVGQRFLDHPRENVRGPLFRSGGRLDPWATKVNAWGRGRTGGIRTTSVRYWRALLRPSPPPGFRWPAKGGSSGLVSINTVALLCATIFPHMRLLPKERWIVVRTDCGKASSLSSKTECATLQQTKSPNATPAARLTPVSSTLFFIYYYYIYYYIVSLLYL